MDNPEKLATQDKQNKNTTQYMYVLDATIGKQTQKTGGKDEPNIVSMRKLQWSSQH